MSRSSLIALIFLMTTRLSIAEDSFSTYATRIQRFKRAPKPIKIVHIYKHSSRRKLKPVYGPPKLMYGPPISTDFLKPYYRRPKPVYGPPKLIYGLPKPIHGLSKPYKINYGLQSPVRESIDNFISPPFSFESEIGDFGVHEKPKSFYNSPQTTHELSSSSYIPSGAHLPDLSLEQPFQKNHGPPSYSQTLNCAVYGTNPSTPHSGNFATAATHSPGYELPPPDSAFAPLNHDPPNASYGTPDAVTSYGTPVHHSRFTSRPIHNEYGYNPVNKWRDDVLGLSSDVVKHFSQPELKSEKINPKRRRIKAKESTNSEFKSPNHNYDGEGIPDDPIQRLFSDRDTPSNNDKSQ